MVPSTPSPLPGCLPPPRAALEHAAPCPARPGTLEALFLTACTACTWAASRRAGDPERPPTSVRRSSRYAAAPHPRPEISQRRSPSHVAGEKTQLPNTEENCGQKPASEVFVGCGGPTCPTVQGGIRKAGRDAATRILTAGRRSRAGERVGAELSGRPLPLRPVPPRRCDGNSLFLERLPPAPWAGWSELPPRPALRTCWADFSSFSTNGPQTQRQRRVNLRFVNPFPAPAPNPPTLRPDIKSQPRSLSAHTMSGH